MHASYQLTSWFQLVRDRIACSLCFCLLLVVANQALSQESEVRVWEFDPYRVRIWVSIDPALGLNAKDQEKLLRDIELQSDIAFGAAWRAHAVLTPRVQSQSVLKRQSAIKIDDLLAADLSVIVAKDNKELSSVRTLETAIEKLEKIALGQAEYDEIVEGIKTLPSDSPLQALIPKLDKREKVGKSLVAEVTNKEAVCAIVRNIDVSADDLKIRKIPMRLPWQSDAVMRQNDKLFLVSITRNAQNIRVESRELDCPMKLAGRPAQNECLFTEVLPEVIVQQLVDSFTPVVRIEEVKGKVAYLRTRAGGMILTDNHPALITPGDVLMPMVRMDDRTGVPSLLDKVPWTYIAVTGGDHIKLTGTVVSGVRGGLEGRQNKRTQRVALRVRPTLATSDLRFTVRGASDIFLPGVAVFKRLPGGGDMKMIGRSDWRGILPITEAELPELEYDLLGPNGEVPQGTEESAAATAPSEPAAEAPKAEQPAAPENAAAPSGDATKSEGSSEAGQASSGEQKNETPAPTEPVIPDKPAKPMGKIKLKVPLYLYYVKNGDTVLAKLPIITGYNPVELADLPDDRRRLEAEAFIRGLETEVLDAIVRRKIFIKRIETHLERKEVQQAKDLLNQLRESANYERMTEKLAVIQRKIFDQEKGPLPLGAAPRIDAMILQIREIMQKYLQDTAERELERQVNELEASGEKPSG